MLTLHWHCTDTALVLSWYLVLQLVLHTRGSTGAVGGSANATGGSADPGSAKQRRHEIDPRKTGIGVGGHVGETSTKTWVGGAPPRGGLSRDSLNQLFKSIGATGTARHQAPAPLRQVVPMGPMFAQDRVRGGRFGPSSWRPPPFSDVRRTSPTHQMGPNPGGARII